MGRGKKRKRGERGSDSPKVGQRYSNQRRGDRLPICITVRQIVLTRDDFKCVFCGDTRLLQMDHIQPWSNLGADSPRNLRTLCGECNLGRSNKRSRDDKPREESPETQEMCSADDYAGCDRCTMLHAGEIIREAPKPPPPIGRAPSMWASNQERRAREDAEQRRLNGG